MIEKLTVEGAVWMTVRMTEETLARSEITMTAMKQDMTAGLGVEGWKRYRSAF